MYSKPQEDFFFQMRERYKVFLLRERGLPPPWTSDPILRNNRFCNVFREDDRTTAWFRDNMRNHVDFSASIESVLLTTIAFRWFNKIAIGELLKDSAIGLQRGTFNVGAARDRIRHEFPNGPFVTGAYIVKTPNGMNKLDGVLWCIDQVRPMADSLAIKINNSQSLYSSWAYLREFPYLGDFMSYEVVTDLRYTGLLSNAEDTLTWANPGPGCTRGISRMLYGNPDQLSRTSRKDRELMDAQMTILLAMSREEKYWPWQDRPWEAREVEHGLCEYDKYHRVSEGGRMKQRFNDMGRSDGII